MKNSTINILESNWPGSGNSQSFLRGGMVKIKEIYIYGIFAIDLLGHFTNPIFLMLYN